MLRDVSVQASRCAPTAWWLKQGRRLINVVISALFIRGGRGLGMIAHVIRKRHFPDYALHTKVMLVGTLVRNVVAMLAVLALEYGNPGPVGPLTIACLLATWRSAAIPYPSGRVNIG